MGTKKSSLNFQFLTQAELEQKSTDRLLRILNSTRAIISCIEWNWEEGCEVSSQPYVEYRQTLKSILETREHIPSRSNHANRPGKAKRGAGRGRGRVLLK